MGFFKTIQALLPTGRAFETVEDSNMRKFCKSLATLPDNVKSDAEHAYLDLFPDTTRQLDDWEKEFSIYFKSKESAKRRAIIAEMWKTSDGTQSALYLQQVLRTIDENICVIENIPLANPRDKNIAIYSCCGNKTMCCGNKKSICKYYSGSDDFVPEVLMNDTTSTYAIPVNSLFWEMCFFVCKSVNRNIRNEILYIEPLTISSVWKNYIEYLILRLKPTHTAAVVFIKWED